jgi:D-sorbitol dehydrogenase (acceptor)
MSELKGKVAMITGGASGIGRAIAKAMAGAGAQVWVTDIESEATSATAAGIGLGARGVALDVTNAESIARTIDFICGQSAQIDILVNAAGCYRLEPWLEVTEVGFDNIIGVNMRGLLFMTQSVGALMVAGNQGGTIINIASVAGRRGDPISVVYSASKAAVISLTQSAASAFASHGIRVNAIAPGPILTPMFSTSKALRSRRLGTTDDSVEHALTERIPLRRCGLPEEIATTAIFLASDASSYVTGQTLNVDGGLSMN